MSFDTPKHTGLSYAEEIPIIENAVSEAEFAGYCQKMRQRYVELAKNWTPELNTDWFVRHYLAMKMFLAATVMMTSSRYAAKKNLQIVEPYLLYYAALTCCRGLVFTLPEHPSGENLFEMTHSKTLNLAVGAIARISKTLAHETELTVRAAREQRELFSYKFPAQGISRPKNSADWDSIQRVCSLLGELAQLRSECLHAAVEKYAGKLPVLKGTALERCFAYKCGDGVLFDGDDVHRIGFWKRQKAGPYNLNLLATAGLVEDYFGSWLGDEAQEITADIYDPDADWSVIFPFR
jgi:hypothetical protein